MKSPCPAPGPDQPGSRFNFGAVTNWLLFGAVLLASFASHAAPTTEGLYAGFVTSKGDFWCRLEFQKAPRTVANFVGLVEGTRDWIDFKTSRIERRPFYPGITFHRVIDKFMIQTGSPNGQGTDGPGYQFADEFHSTLKHGKAGTLSMANSGKNSNGSQFFITVTNTPWLDGVHSIFGEVVEGMDVVHAISKLPTGANDRPVTPIVIQDLQILRIGAAAVAFNPAGVVPPLPDVGIVPSALRNTSSNLSLLLKPRTNHMQHVFFGADFTNWASQSFRSTPTNINATSLKGQPKLFFRALDGGIEP